MASFDGFSATTGGVVFFADFAFVGAFAGAGVFGFFAIGCAGFLGFAAFAGFTAGAGFRTFAVFLAAGALGFTFLALATGLGGFAARATGLLAGALARLAGLAATLEWVGDDLPLGALGFAFKKTSRRLLKKGCQRSLRCS
ncbi:MAG: hypothetical protein ACREKL_06490 [Chthoniobacterales bacterium]